MILNKRADVAMCILDLSESFMYDFSCNYIKEKHVNKAKLLFIGTDSLINEIETNNVYNNFHKNKASLILLSFQIFQFYDKPNKKVTVKMKATDFVGLKSKMNWYIKGDAIGNKKIIIKTLKIRWHIKIIKVCVLKRNKWDTKLNKYKVNLIYYKHLNSTKFIYDTVMINDAKLVTELKF